MFTVIYNGKEGFEAVNSFYLHRYCVHLLVKPSDLFKKYFNVSILRYPGKIYVPIIVIILLSFFGIQVI